MAHLALKGPRTVLTREDAGFPEGLLQIPSPPKELFVLGDPTCLEPGLAVIGARKATPYGESCASHFATLAAEKGICIISGGARGCDAASHKAALACGGRTVVFLGGGIDLYYPACHGNLFQDVVSNGGAVVSEYPWDTAPLPFMFRMRNRLIAGLAQAVLIVEAGLPSGTFSTADDALACGKEVLVVPGSITSATSRGSNRLLYQGATPIVDDESFEQALFDSLGVLKSADPQRMGSAAEGPKGPLLSAILAGPMTADAIYALAVSTYGPKRAREAMNEILVEAVGDRLIERGLDGRWGPVVA